MGNCLKMTDKRRILALLELGWPYRRIAQPVDGWHAVGTRPGATRGQPDGPARSLGATSLGEYLVPVNADAPDVTVEFVGVRDDVVNPLGVKVQPVVSTGVCKDRNHRSWPHRQHAKSSTMTPSLQGAMSMPIMADGWSAGPNWEPSWPTSPATDARPAGRKPQPVLSEQHKLAASQ